MKKLIRLDLIFAYLLLTTLCLTGCAHNRVTPLPNTEVVALDADDVVQVMVRAGFSEKQILKLGTDLRNRLAATGAAQISIDGKVEAIFAVRGPYLHVSSRRRGSFIYDAEKDLIQ